MDLGSRIGSLWRIVKILNNNHGERIGSGYRGGEAAWEAENKPSRKLVRELETE